MSFCCNESKTVTNFIESVCNIWSIVNILKEQRVFPTFETTIRRSYGMQFIPWNPQAISPLSLKIKYIIFAYIIHAVEFNKSSLKLHQLFLH
jgi:hypothetical protein